MSNIRIHPICVTRFQYFRTQHLKVSVQKGARGTAYGNEGAGATQSLGKYRAAESYDMMWESGMLTSNMRYKQHKP